MKNRIIKSLSTIIITSVLLFTQVGCSLSNVDEPKKPSKIENNVKIEKDELTTVNDEVSKAFENVVDAVNKNDLNSQKAAAKLMIGKIGLLKAEIEKDFESTEKVLKKYDNNILNDRYKSYRTEMNSRIEKTEKILNDLSKSDFNSKEKIKSLNEIFNEKTDYQPTAVPSRTTETDLKSEEINSKIKYTKNSYSKASSDDLKFDTETTINDDIKKVADELGTARNVYEYVKNTFNNEFYEGSRKGAVGTFEQLGGNDTDQASLLIGMLRYLDIPARYATGTITITPEQAVDITGASDAENAGRMLGAQYKPVSRVTKNGELYCYKMQQTWVEAYVPYTDYRGAGNKSGENVWVSLDPSFKQIVVQEKNVTAEYSDMDKYIAKQLKNIDSKYSLEQNYDVHLRQINGNIDKYLPVSLPYQLVSKDSVYSTIPNSKKDSIAITIGWESLMSCSTAELYGKNITVYYDGAEQYDRDLIKSYGGVDKVPAYLVNVVPVVKVGDKEYRGEWGVSLGTTQQMHTYITNRGGTSSLTDNVIAGSVYAVNLDLQRISEKDAERSYNRMEKAQQNVESLGAYSGEYLGAVLDYAGKTYFSSCDAFSQTATLSMDINRNRQLALAFTGYTMKSESIFGYVRNLHYGSFYIDVAYNNVTALSYSGNKDDEIKFMLTEGMQESAFEGSLWKTLLNDKTFGICTVSMFETAKSMNIDLSIITSENLEKELSSCNVSDVTKRDVRNFVNQGYVVTIIPQDLQVNSWNGTAYIAMDLKNGSGSYMLSGGTAGGSTSNDIKLTTDSDDISVSKAMDLCFYINNTLYLLNMANGLKGLSQAAGGLASAAVNPLGYLASAVPLVSSVKSISEAYVMYYDNVGKYCDYMVSDSDENAADFAKFTLNNLLSFIKGFFIDNFVDLGKININGVDLEIKEVFNFINTDNIVSMSDAAFLDTLLQCTGMVPPHNSMKLIDTICKMIDVKDGDFLSSD